MDNIKKPKLTLLNNSVVFQTERKATVILYYKS